MRAAATGLGQPWAGQVKTRRGQALQIPGVLTLWDPSHYRHSLLLSPCSLSFPVFLTCTKSLCFRTVSLSLNYPKDEVSHQDPIQLFFPTRNTYCHIENCVRKSKRHSILSLHLCDVWVEDCEMFVLMNSQITGLCLGLHQNLCDVAVCAQAGTGVCGRGLEGSGVEAAT